MISLIIPVHNATECVINLIENLKNTEARDYDIIFVDDASELDTHKVLVEYASEFPNVQILKNTKQQLFTRTLNRGIRAAQPNTEYFICINTDCELSPGWLNSLIAVMEFDKSCAICGYPDGVPENKPLEKIGVPNYITGHCICIRRKALEELGVFCETDHQQAHIASERIWCWKALNNNWTSYYVHNPLCLHRKDGPSWGRDINWLWNFNYSQLWEGRDTL